MKDTLNPSYQTEHLYHIQTEFQRGLSIQDCVGLHATSIITIQKALQTGIIPGNTISGPNDLPHIRKGDICFVPIDIDGIWEAVRSIETYGEAIAFSHTLLTELGIDLDNRFYDDLAAEFGFTYQMESQRGSEMSWDQVDEYAQDFNIESGRFREAVFQAKRAKGVIIGINKSVETEFPIEPDEDIFNHANRMRTGIGLPIRYIKGIVPLGFVEREILSSL